eukprot:TRINITY_DN31150_c0_g1_i1.p1 TRINITY_DN31150_c0_g1~~TRINITY_DN31150_c0_g1_i1.p1  ORF type:complete len:438 (-),score=76.07 TRINITY_DN31150_c0_g1_i1:101-1414(-)
MAVTALPAQIVQMPIFEATYMRRVGGAPVETSLMAEGIDTVTFFSSDRVPAAYLRGRLAAILRVNPWLHGRFVKPAKKGGTVDAMWDERIAEAKALERVFEVLDPSELPINRQMKYSQLTNIIRQSSAHVGQAKQLMVNAKPFFKLTVVPVPPAEEGKRKSEDNIQVGMGVSTEFAVIMSISSLLVDGTSYYRVLNMILNALPVQRLNFERKEAFWKDKINFKAVGEDPYKWSASCGKMIGRLCSRICGSRPTTFAVQIDMDKLAQAKAVAEGPEEMLSSNDVIVSKIATLSGPRVLSMPVNLRKRMDGYVAEDVGNYSTLMTYFRGDYETPQLIHSSLVPQEGTYRRRGKRATTFPGCCGSLCARELRISNWTMFGKASVAGCEQILHMPIVMPDESRGLSIIFRPKPTELAALFIAKRMDSKSVRKNGGIFSKLI